MAEKAQLSNKTQESAINVPGYRLHTLEVLNWGTYNKPKIARCCLGGEASLLTGKNGSGKSTLVDALITLLVPYQKITYNKAAGVEIHGRKAERSVLTYFKGEYRNEKSEIDGASRPVYLRGENDYSVLLAYFFNAALREGFTIAQVYWFRNEKIEKRFIFSSDELNIKDHFSGFGNDISILHKKLKSLPNTSVCDTFSEYSLKFRTMMGLRSEKALELFYQAVSIKTIGSLTTFMRQHMIESRDVNDEIQALLRNYENLARTHDAVIRAKRQQEILAPIAHDADIYEQLDQELIKNQAVLESLPAYFSSRKIQLLRTEIVELEKRKEIVSGRLDRIKEALTALRGDDSKLRNDYEKDIGNRLTEMRQRIQTHETSREKKRSEFNGYHAIVSSLGLVTPKKGGEGEFVQNKHVCGELQKQLEKQYPILNTERDKLTVMLHTLNEEMEQLSSEIRCCRQSKTQIPEQYRRIRDEMLASLEIDEKEVPFAGELLKIKEDQTDWEVAIEKVLHNFAISLLVPEKYYKQICDYVDRTNLKGKIVYYRVPAVSEVRGAVTHRPNTIFHKIDLKKDSIFHDWLNRQIMERYAYACCDTVEAFQREPMALTKNGQIKSSKLRHEKDDRQNNYNYRGGVLGWGGVNKGRVVVLEQAQKSLSKQVEEKQGQIGVIEKSISSINEKLRQISNMKYYDDYARINWEADVTAIEELHKDIEKLESSNDKTKTIGIMMEGIKAKIIDKEGENDSCQKELGKIENAIQEYSKQEQNSAAIAKDIKDKDKIEVLVLQHIGEGPITLDSINSVQTILINKIRTELGPKIKQQAAVRDRIVVKMKEFKGEFGNISSDLDARIEFIGEFRKMHKKLNEDDLPRYEKKFKDLLNQGTINDILLFKNRLENNAEEIKKKVREISQSLEAIEYNPGTYIELQFEPSQDVDVRTFKSMLNGCLEQADATDVVYNEQRFVKVKEILDKFMRGTTGDAGWTDKVTDVRNWFTFSASEKYSEDGSLKEYYADTSGKSGGQKERLCYTILAAALVFQYGLETEQGRDRAFRLMLLEEAFSRATDSAAEYAMSLFTKMGFQVFVVTPEQKLHVIENYVQSIHYAYNTEEGNNSSVVSFSIEQYRDRKAEIKQEAELSPA